MLLVWDDQLDPDLVVWAVFQLLDSVLGVADVVNEGVDAVAERLDLAVDGPDAIANPLEVVVAPLEASAVLLVVPETHLRLLPEVQDAGVGIPVLAVEALRHGAEGVVLPFDPAEALVEAFRPLVGNGDPLEELAHQFDGEIHHVGEVADVLGGSL